ncbi:MAG: hypothetical protein LBG11_12370, partial [Bifidobacteriaceae bacterium]|nr:hypothetical protein [Bifidobacteriaceae bacterium]
SALAEFLALPVGHDCYRLVQPRAISELSRRFDVDLDRAWVTDAQLQAYRRDLPAALLRAAGQARERKNSADWIRS